MKKSIVCLLAGAACLTAHCQEFFDMSEAPEMITYGARIGFNTSTTTRNAKNKLSTLDGWGTGFDLGAVVSLHLNNALSLQPGLFFESRNHSYSYVFSNPTTGNPNIHEYGHTRTYDFQVPVMGVLSLYPDPDFAWSLEAGPYFRFGFGGKDKGLSEVGMATTPYNIGYYKMRHGFDFGFKLGSGLTFRRQYYVGIHYLAGCTSAWKYKQGGHNKEWTFTLGYNF